MALKLIFSNVRYTKQKRWKEVVMPVFLVEKWQSVQDAWGDSFAWRHERLVIESSDGETLKHELTKVNGVEVYSNEYLRFTYIGEHTPESRSISLRDFLAGYPTALEKLDE